MQTGLFRAEATTHLGGTNAFFGEASGVPPPSWARVTWLLSLFMASLAAFLFSVSLARSETARGVLRFDSAEARVLAPADGTVHAVFVAEGDKVVAGQPVAEVRSDRFLPAGGSLNASRLASITREKDGLLAQRQAIAEAFNAAAQLEAQAQQDAKRREETAHAKRGIVSERLAAAKQRRDDLAELREKGLVAEPVYSERVDAIAFLQQDLLEIDREIAEARSSATRSSTESTRLKANTRRELAEMSQRLAQADLQLEAAAAESGYVVRAPHAGRISGIRIRTGEGVSSAEPLAVIVPEGSELLAEFYLPSRSIGLIRRGQAVKLKYDAFPHQKFGMSSGTVAEVALIGQPAQELGLATQSPDLLYRVYVKLESASVDFQGPAVPAPKRDGT